MRRRSVASGSVPVPVVAIVSIGDAFLRVGRSRRMAWSYGLQPLRERSVKIFERHDVFAVFEARANTQSVRFLFRRCSRGIRFRFVLFLQVRPYVFVYSR